MKSKRLFVLLILLSGNFGTTFAVRAAAPVVDLSSSASQEASSVGLEVDQEERVSSRAVTNHQNEPLDQRVMRLERQIANITETNFASKLEKMQQEMQQLHGQIEVQNHDLAQLKDQVKNFYQDLDQRISKAQPADTIKTKSTVAVENEVAQESESNGSVETEKDTSKTKELQTYEAAFNSLNNKEYDKAISGFQKFVKDFPASSYTGNAHYWLGEIYYLKGKPEQANKEFQTIISNYPDNPKVADAMLKIALIAMDAGNYAKAKINFIKVQKEYPGSTAAKIATLRLKEIKGKK